MFKLKYTFMMLLGALILASCSDEGSRLVSDIESGPNLASFVQISKTVANIADGSEYEIEVPLIIEGPSVPDLSGDITVTIEPDWTGIKDAKRAEVGTHFRLDNNKVTLKAEEDYTGSLTFTMLTDGITAPLDDSPQFNLKAAEVSGAENVIVSGKATSITLNYACPSNLQGVYNVNVNSGAATFTDVHVVKTGVGEYDTNVLGRFGPANQPPNNFTRGVIINDVCGKISVPSQTLAQFSNSVTGVATHEVNGDSQVEGGVTSFTAEFEIEGYGTQTSVFTYQGPLPE